MDTYIHNYVLDRISNERSLQIKKWGDQSHDLPWWMVILGEEYGEACKAVYEATTTVNPKRDTTEWSNNKLLDVVEELIQVAAVAVAILEDMHEHLDKTAGAWRK